jgi:hypothetical protein
MSPDDSPENSRELGSSPRAAWDPPVPRRRKRWPFVVVAVMTAAALVGAGLFFARRTSSTYPSHWDSRVAPIASQVESLRGLHFEHPVAVHFVSAANFEARVGDDGQVDASDREQIEQATAELRAAGLLGGDVDLFDAVNTAQTSGTLAYYDPHAEQIFVRGETLDVAHKVTLAHELTHVLQDQHFDLERRQDAAADSETGDTDAFTALVEGDAVRIEDAYLATLPAADRAAYDKQTQAEGDRFDEEAGDVPEIVKVEFGAPYAYGPYTIRTLLAAGGNRAVDAAISGPAPSGRMFIEPGALSAVAVDDPRLPRDAKPAGPVNGMSAFDIYLVLAARGDPAGALRAADAVTGGRARTYKRGGAGAYCMQVELATQGFEGRTVLVDALRRWRTQVPGATVDDSGKYVTFTACDPGSQATAPSTAALQAAATLIAVRDELTAQLAENNVSADVARCTARLVTRRPTVTQLLVGDTPLSPAQQSLVRSSIRADAERCARDPRAGFIA